MHTLSSTSVYDLRKKNENKNNTGVKLLVRHKNKYESKPLIADPREVFQNQESSDDLGSEESYEERDGSISSSSDEELSEKDTRKLYYK